RGYHRITHGNSEGSRVGRPAARKGALRMKRWQLTIALMLGCTAAALLTAPAAQTGESPSARPTPAVSFDRDIQPILARCVQCHGPSQAKAGLRLDSRQGATAELKSEARAVVPGNPEQSELLYRVTAKKSSERMPPRGDPLSGEQIEKLRRW